MAKVQGKDILVMVDLDALLTTPTGVADWTVVGGQQSATFSEEVEAIDTTTKSDTGYDYVPGRYGWTVSCDGLYVKNDEGYTALKTAMRQGKKVKLRIQEEGQAVEEGLAIITSKELEAGYEESATYSVEFQGVGIPTTPVA
ncbi:TP901-1 family phage major tail protein [Neobacillus niacini]|uniref:phage major tail protein, TP901-1 family n=1 Tax=Neobacillus niacini TaxID=86668 RepID=UPI002783CFD7|nr:phage major tail protein, TP901-1 family [Neobacillus niacini]MDQ1003965.1 TP901-1 family phage major tail protein [Neobacillus niacini]